MRHKSVGGWTNQVTCARAERMMGPGEAVETLTNFAFSFHPLPVAGTDNVR